MESSFAQSKSILKNLLAIAASTSIAVSSTSLASSGQYFSEFAWQNPAEMAVDLLPITNPDTGEITDYHQQFTLGEANIWQHIHFVGQSGPPGPPGLLSGVASTNTYNSLVSFSYINRLNSQWVIGLDVGHPFASKITFPADSIVQFVTTNTTEETLDIQPKVSYQPTKIIAIGAGADIEKVDAQIDFNSPQFGPFAPGTLVNKIGDWGYGWHTGVLLHPFLGTLLGLSYFSMVHVNLTGPSTYTGFPTPVTTAAAVATLPSSTRFKVFQALNNNFGLIGRVDYVEWSTFQDIILQNSAIGQVPFPFKFRNVWRYGVGARYAFPKTVINAGFGYDETPNNLANTRVGFAEKNYFTAGLDVEQNLRQNIKVAAGYYHAFVGNVKIDNNQFGILTQGVAQDVYGNEVEVRLTVLA